MSGIGRPPKPPTSVAAPTSRRATATRSRSPPRPPVSRIASSVEDPHQLVESMWEVVQSSAEARFYSAADWARLRMELWNADQVLRSGKPISGNTWAGIQHGLTEMLISPAAKRRAAIELKPPGVDADEVAANNQIARYKTVLKSV